MRPNDVLTKVQMARVIKSDLEFAENILIDLFKEKKLQVLIRVDCNNDDYSHPIWFNSLEEYYFSNKDSLCEECGCSYDWRNARIGFKRGIYKL
ncbi:hypothetical protein [Halobacillus seohaensis]|uniref:hypothetical protein n=1 Tax=Halobacillus seohaensis TaxID=447421 RepID=UPI0036F269E4